ncbi:DUF5131 family protein [Streptomyces acidicola]|uniref:DUF5131 family protein n=1 Tax=Streptomyces acidicola TaxID=2596892 RepID=UPI00380B3CFA
MADSTSIEWTDSTWNPVTDCTKISPGCDITLRPDSLRLPIRGAHPAPFHTDIPDLLRVRRRSARGTRSGEPKVG